VSAPGNYRPAGIKCLKIIRIALADVAYYAIASALPNGAALWPMQRDQADASSKSRRR
jgi:hypothetical protein